MISFNLKKCTVNHASNFHLIRYTMDALGNRKVAGTDETEVQR